MGMQSPAALLESAVEAAGRVRDAASELEQRSALAELENLIDAPVNSGATVALFGERRTARWSLLAALLDRPVLAPREGAKLPAYPLLVRACAAGEPEGAVLQSLSGAPTSVPLDAAMRLAERNDDLAVRFLTFAIDHPLLAAGLTIADAPSDGSLQSGNGRLAGAWAKGADATLLVTGCDAPLNTHEVDFLIAAAAVSGAVLIAADRHDGQHGWREVLVDNRNLVERVEQRGGVSVRTFPTCTRMALRALGAPDEDPLREQLSADSGVPELRAYLGELAEDRDALLRTASLCLAASAVVGNLIAAQQEFVAGAESSDQAMFDRLRDQEDALRDLTTALPGMRRKLNSDLRLLQREAETAANSRLNALRRNLEQAVTDGGVKDFEAEFESQLVAGLTGALAEAGERVEAVRVELTETMAALGAQLEIDAEQFAVHAPVEANIVELTPLRAAKGDWLQRAPLTIGATVINPLYAVVGVAALLFDRTRMNQKLSLDQQIRQIGETIAEARGQLLLAIHHLAANAQFILMEDFEEAAAARRGDLDESIRSVKAHLKAGAPERSQRADAAAAKLKELRSERDNFATIRKAALELTAAGSARAA